jgi:hypothetical protein
MITVPQLKPREMEDNGKNPKASKYSMNWPSLPFFLRLCRALSSMVEGPANNYTCDAPVGGSVSWARVEALPELYCTFILFSFICVYYLCSSP